MTREVNIKDEIISQIYFVRGRKVMLDSDLARICGVTTARLNQQVCRNSDRFPADFRFQMTYEEAGNLMLQIATSSSKTIENTDGFRLDSKNEPRTPVGFRIGKQDK